jgi:uncharacterized protein YdcH (DUF465 family)
MTSTVKILKEIDNHVGNLIDKHYQLDAEIDNASEVVPDEYVTRLKKERLKTKDELSYVKFQLSRMCH